MPTATAGWPRRNAPPAPGLKLGSVERYARTDTSVTGQALKIIAAKPDAVLIAGSGTPAALPQKALHERGYTGTVYQTHGVANNDFLRVGGKDVEGTILPVGPIVVAAQLPDGNPIKPVALDYVHRYEAANGAGSVAAFGAHAWDAGLLLQAAMPVALKDGKPGTPEFRAALRDAWRRKSNLTLCHGIATMTPDRPQRLRPARTGDDHHPGRRVEPAALKVRGQGRPWSGQGPRPSGVRSAR